MCQGLGLAPFTSTVSWASRQRMRAENPARFWFRVVLYEILGTLGLYYAWLRDAQFELQRTAGSERRHAARSTETPERRMPKARWYIFGRGTHLAGQICSLW
jgi:hypothetical protein